MQVQTVLRIRLELAEISKKTQNYQFLATFLAYKCVWQLQKSSFPSKVKIGVDSAEDTRRRLISVALPNSWPIMRYDQKTVPTHKQVLLIVMRTSGITTMPRSFCEFRSEFFNSSLNRTCKGIECRPCCFFFWTSFGRFCFLEIVRSIMSLGKINEEIEGRNSMRRLVRELHRVQTSSLNS